MHKFDYFGKDLLTYLLTDSRILRIDNDSNDDHLTKLSNKWILFFNMQENRSFISSNTSTFSKVRVYVVIAKLSPAQLNPTSTQLAGMIYYQSKILLPPYTHPHTPQ